MRTKIQAPSVQNSAPTTPQTSNSHITADTPKLGTFAGTDLSVYIKDLMKLPVNMNELIFMLQQKLNNMQLNKIFEAHIAARRNLLSQTQAQILAQLQGLTTSDVTANLQNTLNSELAASIKNLKIDANQMINLTDIAALIQTNGKDAITKLILAMANASKQGVTDLMQLKETAKLINASIALASSENSNQTLKTLMLLYLPWLPLQEGVDFLLETEASAENTPEDSILIISIITVNFGLLKAILLPETTNFIHINIECDEKFPKEELLTRIKNEQKNYSMESLISIETKKSSSEPKTSDITNAKINLSQSNQISPYLLLCAHSIIRHTIELDRLHG